MSPPVRVLGYGSLSSARGLGRHGQGILDGWPVAVDGARRRFAKPSQKSACLAMDLTPPHPAALGARRLSPSDVPSEEGFEALLLVYPAEVTPDVARREGYAPALWQRLLDQAGARGLGALLLELAHDADDDPVAYRAALRRRAGPNPLKAYHYVPHPVLTDEGPAVIFVAPEPGQTGDPERPSCKVALGAGYLPGALDQAVAGARAAFASQPEEAEAAQVRYAEMCLLAAAHGLWVRDLVGGGLREGSISRLLERWRHDPSPLIEERQALRTLIPAWRDDAHHARLTSDDLRVALERSGLFGLAPGD